MKQSTAILRGLNDIRADYILESELSAEEPAASYRPTAKEAWQHITSSGWYVAAVCAIVAFGTLAGIIWAGQRGPGVVTPAGTLPESTEEITLEPSIIDLRVLKETTSYDAEGNEVSRTKYTYDGNGWLLEERLYTDGNGFSRKVYTYNADGYVIQEKHIFDGIASAGWTTTYEYDEEGRVILKRDIYDSDKPTEETRTEYDEQGRVLRRESSDSITTYTYGENNSYTALTELKNEDTVNRLEVTLDPNGNPLRKRNYRNGELTSEHVFEYNEDGQQIKVSSCITYDSTSLSDVTYYDYDERGNLIRVTFANDKDQINGFDSYEYNEYGERIRNEFHYTESESSSELILYSIVVYEYGAIS